MAKAYPKSKFYGFDYHLPSIERASELASEAGVGDRITFAQASAKDFPANSYDMVAFFDCLHDMGDPIGAGKHVKETLAKDGIWMIVEPFAHDNLKDNLNPVGRVYYSASTFICTPAAHSRDDDQVFQAMVITDSSDRDQVRRRTRLTGLCVLEMASWSRLAIDLEIVPAVHGRAPCAARSAPTSDVATRAGGACGPAGRSCARCSRFFLFGSLTP